MLDIPSLNTRPIQPVEASRARRPIVESGGQNTPANGTALPANALPAKRPDAARAPELPELERLAEGISNFVRSISRDLSFRVDEASGHMVVTVIDSETKDVIRQIPSEEFLRMAEALATTGSLLLDTEA